MNREATNYPKLSLYVGDLLPNTTEYMLYEKFSDVGPIRSVHICRDKKTKCSLGYGFVNFDNPDDAKRAFDTMNSEVINGRPIRIMWPRCNLSRSTNVYKIFIKNLEKSIDSKLLYETFKAVGNVLNCNVFQYKNGKSKGYGFVHFETQTSVCLSILRFNGMMWKGKRIHVTRYFSRCIV